MPCPKKIKISVKWRIFVRKQNRICHFWLINKSFILGKFLFYPGVPLWWKKKQNKQNLSFFTWLNEYAILNIWIKIHLVRKRWCVIYRRWGYFLVPRKTIATLMPKQMIKIKPSGKINCEWLNFKFLSYRHR